MSQLKLNYALERIHADIAAERFSFDEIINEKTLAAEYGVSKTPVREALNILCHQGILVKYSGKGYFLKELSFSEFCMLRELRFMLESGIIKKLIEKSSDEELQQLLDTVDANLNGYPENLAFHFRLAEMTKNVLVEQEIKNIFNRFIRQRTLEDQHFDITESHRSIVKALLARDEKLALKCLKDDLIPPHDEMIWT